MYLHGHANIGYGAAHNLVLHGTGSDYHLVLNPDVELAADALVNGVRWLDAHPDVGALAPPLRDADGNAVYLCKRYPAVFDLLLRGFAPRFVRRAVPRRLARYEMRDIVDVDPPRDVIGVPALSGAFMLVRRDAIDRTGGFDPRFFLYFEDFDWSVRLNAVTRNAYVPSGADRPPRRRRGAQGPASHRAGSSAQRLALLSRSTAGSGSDAAGGSPSPARTAFIGTAFCRHAAAHGTRAGRFVRDRAVRSGAIGAAGVRSRHRPRGAAGSSVGCRSRAGGRRRN